MTDMLYLQWNSYLENVICEIIGELIIATL